MLAPGSIPGARPHMMCAVVLIGVVLLEGCQDITRVAPKEQGVTHIADVAPALMSSQDWNHFSADFRIAIAGGARSAAEAGPERVIAYHTDRDLGADGKWTTTVTYSQLRTAVPGRRPAVSKLVRYDNGEAEVFDTAGRRFDPSSVAGLSSRYTRKFPAMPPRPAHMTSTTRANPDVRGWSRNILIDVTGAAKARRSVERSLGKARRSEKGRAHYAATYGDETLEAEIDEVTGLVAEERRSNGRGLTYTTYAYQEITPGIFLKNSARSERVPADKSQRPMVVTQTISNVRFDRRGGI